MTKTNFIDRLFNLKPKIRIYDLDGTIIDSSHRIQLGKMAHLIWNIGKRTIQKKIFLGFFIAIILAVKSRLY